ncbi:chemotaxis protein CheD [Rhizobium sp. SL86]|uniref:chemotaxis protein CheD n=1 Tax=Rhizobium sp. SL86 TaxID=2995148 RepID=UPI00227629FB|nr:chemotaxis protein CheD [Rhizobium sp. SL86]MCY1667991.1 chemotaxis protein CheD [Rhizobium sp. SL86]
MEQNNDDLEVIHLLSGQCLVSNDVNTIFSTVLGSCVCACIYDPVRAVGGMNHFVLPNGGKDAPSAQRHRYGDVAMASLVAGLCRRGARRERLVAKLFGGRLRDDSSSNPGALNADYAKNFLQSNGIKLVEAHLGGNVARWVTFHPATGRTSLRETEDFTPLSGISREVARLPQRAF